MASNAGATPVLFTGVDAGAGPGTTYSSSNAAAASFASAAGAIGTTKLITFESVALGAFSTITVGTGVTLTTQGGNSIISNEFTDLLSGFNTTPGGSQYIDVESVYLTFNFATGINSFGAYFTGVQDGLGTELITFDDGTSQSIALTAPPNNSGGVEFIGFTDAGHKISSVTIGSADDSIGIDDVRYGVVPEPSSFVLLGTGTLSMLGLVRRRLIRS